MSEKSPAPDFEKLRVRIEALRARTLENGCTQAEALMAAAKVAELLDRHDLSLSDVEIRAAPCDRRAFETHRKKRIPIEDCIAAVAAFCDCRVWRERNAEREASHVFFGLRSDVEAAICLTELIDETVRFELGRYKTSPAYGAFRHQDRHLANSSFALGMVSSIARRLDEMKRSRDAAHLGDGRNLVVLKSAVVDAELEKLDLKLKTVRRAGRMIAPPAFDAGEVAGASVALGKSQASGRDVAKRGSPPR